MCAFKPDLETGEHTFNLGHIIFCWKPVRSSAYMPLYCPLNCKQAPWIKCFLHRVVVSPHSNRNLTSTSSPSPQKAEDNTVESVLSFHYVGLGHQTLVIWSHLTGPKYILKQYFFSWFHIFLTLYTRSNTVCIFLICSHLSFYKLTDTDSCSHNHSSLLTHCTFLN